MPLHEWLDEVRDRSWVADAACGKGYGPDLDDFHSATKRTALAAAQFCVAYCTVREECLEDAMRAEEGKSRSGVFGGYTASDRSRLATQRRKTATTGDPPGGAP